MGGDPMGEDDTVILAIDQGTSSSKAMLVDRRGSVMAESSCAVGQQFPQSGWVEQDPEEIVESVRRAVAECVGDRDPASIAGVALSVQRETVIAWDTTTGAALGPALSWQDQRTTAAASALEQAGHADYVFATSGLPLDPMFSALKAAWLLDTHDPDREHSGSGRWRVGTVDAWLTTRLTGSLADPIIEVGNASRTQLLDIGTGRWDPRLLDIFGVPEAALPRVVPSTGPFPAVSGLSGVADGTPILAVLADSHAALFAHAGWRTGVVKATYGTGSSVMTVLGPSGADECGRDDTGPTHGVCTTIAWDTSDDGHLTRAAEANIRSTGRTVSWVAELCRTPVDEIWAHAEAAAADGVVIVPAFGGLGAPYWDREATALVTGLTLGTGTAQLARAAMESVAMQVDDVLTAFAADVGPLQQLACDGGMTRSTGLMQLQADVSGVPVGVSATANLSAWGTACLAGLRLGWWTRADVESGTVGGENRAVPLKPDPDYSERDRLRHGWAQAIARSRHQS